MVDAWLTFHGKKSGSNSSCESWPPCRWYAAYLSSVVHLGPVPSSCSVLPALCDPGSVTSSSVREDSRFQLSSIQRSYTCPAATGPAAPATAATSAVSDALMPFPRPRWPVKSCSQPGRAAEGGSLAGPCHW